MSEPKRYWVCWHDQRRLDEGEEASDGGDVMVDYADYAHLKAEVERLDTLCKQLSRQHSDISCENIMLRKAGDEMASTLRNGGIIVSGYALADEWLKAKLIAAKDGKSQQ